MVRRRRVVEERGEADARARSGRRAVSAPWLGTCASSDEQADAEQHQREPGPRDRQHREAEERERASADGAERAREDDPGVEDLEADPGDAGEEEQRDDVRVDQRSRGTASQKPGSTSSISAPAVWSVNGRPARSCAAVDLRQQRRQRRRDQRRSRSSSAPRPRSGSTPRARPRRPRRRCGRGSSRAPRSDAAASLTTLRRRSLPMFAPLDVDRRRRADVRLRRHREHVGRLRRSRRRPRRRARRRRDVDDHRDLRRELLLDDLAHRVREPAGRVEHDHDRVVAVVVRPVELAVQPVLRDRVDVVRRSGSRAREARSAAPPQCSRPRRRPRRASPSTSARFTAVRIVFGRGSPASTAKRCAARFAPARRR